MEDVLIDIESRVLLQQNLAVKSLYLIVDASYPTRLSSFDSGNRLISDQPMSENSNPSTDNTLSTVLIFCGVTTAVVVIIAAVVIINGFRYYKFKLARY